MTDVIAGQPATLLSQWYPYDGGPLTDLDATPTIGIAAVATGAVALAPTTTGVTHPGVGSYGYAWTPAASLTAGTYLVTWSGLKSGSPVSAAETVTVYAPPAAADPGADADTAWYATREDVMRAFDSKLTARNSAQIDRVLEAASRDVDLLCHRTFYPLTATKAFDWPSRQNATPWVLRLDNHELISVSVLESGGTTITDGQYFLEPAKDGPPYSRVEINLAGSASFGGGDTYQRDIQISGLWGYTKAEAAAGTVAEVLDPSETSVTVSGAAAAALGVGSVIRVDAERMKVTGRALSATGQTLAADIDKQVATVIVPVADASGFAVDEVILIDGERMLITDIAGNNLIVKRAWDGSPNAAHTAGATIYASRTLTVTRAALGTTAGAHIDASPIYRWTPPGPVRQLAIAEAISSLTSESSAYTRAQRSGDGSGERNRDTSALKALRDAVYDSHGRKARHRAV